jgi:hypothetical protein
MLKYTNSSKFKKSIKLENDHYILTPNGKVRIEYVHKTIPFDMFRITTELGHVLECASHHVIMTSKHKEVFALESLNQEVITEQGNAKIISVEDLGYSESMIDFSLESKEEVYFSNGILSHNSGKCATGDAKITVKNKVTSKVEEVSMKAFFDRS